MRSLMTACRLMAAIPALIAVDARAEQTIVPRYEGEVTTDNLCAFVEGFFDRLDGFVGMKVRVDPVDETVDGQRRFAGESDGALLLYCVKDMEGLEVVVNAEPRTEAGTYGISGFFAVKSGGTHQGTTSVGLMPVDEAAASGSGARIAATPVP